jgi:hypothetical protein
VAIREDEAVIVREMVRRVIEGESFRSVALELNRRGVTTQHGATWNALKGRNILTHKRYAGIREHHDQEYTAEWPAIIDTATAELLEIAIVNHRRQFAQRGPGRKFLLTGFTYCGRCGKRLNTSPKKRRDGSTKSRYACVARDEGQGRRVRSDVPPDRTGRRPGHRRRPVSARQRRFRPRASAVDVNPDVSAPVDRSKAQQQRLDDLLEDYSTSLLTRTEYTAARSTAQAHLDDLNRQIDSASMRTAVSGLPVGGSARAA